MRNGGLWTESRFKSFIISSLRSASNRWGPKFEVKKAARVARGVYMCAGYNVPPHEAPASFINEKGQRKNNITVDHIEPVIDPKKGFISFDAANNRMFCEKDGLQVLCDS